MTLRRRTPLRRSGALRRTGRLRPVSDRRRARDAVYPSSRRAVYGRAEGMCEARIDDVCEGHGWQVHHIAGRVGPDPHRLENLLLMCGPCHAWVHANPAAAYAAGLMAHRHRKES